MELRICYSMNPASHYMNEPVKKAGSGTARRLRSSKAIALAIEDRGGAIVGRACWHGRRGDPF